MIQTSSTTFEREDPAMSASLEATALHVAYRDGDVLSEVSLNVTPGSITGLFGPNGVGKTTLLKTLAGFLLPRLGEVRVGGTDPVVDAAAARQVCLVGTGAEAPVGWSASRALALHARVRPTWDQAYADRLIAALGLDVRKSPLKLSLGQKSALSMIIGLASRTPVTLFDEVTVGMDAQTRHVFAAEIARENAELGRTFVVSTHLITDVEALVGDAIVLAKQGITFAGSTEVLRGHLCAVTGKDADVAAAVHSLGLPVVSTSSLGSTSRWVLRCSPSALGSASGITVEPLSLEDAVIALTSAPGPTP